jgi:hypothetical protein
MGNITAITREYGICEIKIGGVSKYRRLDFSGSGRLMPSRNKAVDISTTKLDI